MKQPAGKNNPRPTTSRMVALADLDWDTDSVEPDKVKSIAASFADTKHQISEIQIRPAGGHFPYRVVAGRNRCEAAKLVGWTELRAVELPYKTKDDKLRAELIEIDENLARKSMSPAAEASATARRKTIYEQLYPETRRGVAGGKARQGSASEKISFADTQAAISGKTPRAVQLVAARAAALGQETLAAVEGTSLDKGTELDALAKLPPDRRAEVVKRASSGGKVKATTVLKQVAREEREQKLAAKQLALPTQKFGVLLEDFEWDHSCWNRETGMNRHPANHYPTASDAHTPEEIVARTAERFACAADDAGLFMWATAPHLPVALDVMRLRGFAYSSHVIWKKQKPGKQTGLGYVFRIDHELLLYGTRGKVPAPAPGTQWRSVMESPAGKHSAKPDWQYELIEQYFPNLPKIELNAVGAARPGWTVWGNQAEPAAAAAIEQPAPPPASEAEPANAAAVEQSAAKDFVKFLADGTALEISVLECFERGLTVQAETVTDFRARKLVRGHIPRLTKLGEERLAELKHERDHKGALAELPDDIDALIEGYRVTLAQRHAAVLANDTRAAALTGELLDLLQQKANGGSSVGMATSDSPAERLRRETAAPIGEVPLWGQRGIFRLEIEGTPYLVHHDERCHFDVYAEDPAKPFISESGYRSMLGDIAFGVTVAEQAEAFVREEVYTPVDRKSGRRTERKGALLTAVRCWYRLPKTWNESDRPVEIGGKHAWQPAAALDRAGDIGDPGEIPAFLDRKKAKASAPAEARS